MNINNIHYVKTTLRDDTELVTVYSGIPTNVTYTFLTCLPQTTKDDMNFPGIYYCKNTTTVNIIEFDDVKKLYDEIYGKILTITSSNINGTYAAKLKKECEDIANRHTKTLDAIKSNYACVHIKSTMDVSLFHDLYSKLLKYKTSTNLIDNIIDAGVNMLKLIEIDINKVRKEIENINSLSTIEQTLDTIIKHVYAMSKSIKGFDSTFQSCIGSLKNLKLKLNIQTYPSVVQENVKTLIDQICAYIIIHQPNNSNCSLRSLISTLDSYYNVPNSIICIPYNNPDSYKNWIDYSIHYKFLIECEHTSWINTPTIKIDRINNTVTIDNETINAIRNNKLQDTITINETNLPNKLTYLKQLQQNKWLISINQKLYNENPKPINSIHFILNSVEFLHLEPNTMP